MTAPLVMPTTDILDQGNRPGDGPLRPGGESRSMLPQAESNLPSTWGKVAKAQQASLALMRDVISGSERIRSLGATYLPQAPGEDGANYKVRLARSVFFGVVGHTVKGLVGQVFRRDPRLGDDVPPAIVEHSENIDLAGTHFDVFARDLLTDALAAGHCAVLVDFPKTGGAQSAAAELSAIRPYWVPIKKDNIVSWRSTVENGRQILTQLVLREVTTVPSGQYGEQEQTQYRVLYRENGVVGFELLHVAENRVVTRVDEGTYPTQDEIPVAEIVTSGRKGLFDSEPPLLGLAHLNIAHYQQWSDYATSIHKTCVPILTIIGGGVDEGEAAVVVGPNTVLNLPKDGRAEYVSHSGQALGACKQALDDLKSDMGTLGLAMLSPQKRTAETAQAKRLDKATEDSALAVTARGLQDGLERALDFHARYLRLDDGGSVSINREFDEQTMQADMLTAWSQAVANAGIPERLMAEAMQAGGLIDPDEDIEAITDEMMGNKAAKEAQAAAQSAANLDAIKSAGDGNTPPDKAAPDMAAMKAAA